MNVYNMFSRSSGIPSTGQFECLTSPL